MGFPIATDGQAFNVFGVRPLYEFQTKEDFEAGKKRKPKTDANGEEIYAISVPLPGADMVVDIRVAGKPHGVTKGSMIRVDGLTINPYRMERNGRTFEGVTYRADKVIVATPAAKAS